MAMYITGDLVSRTRTGDYKLSITQDILKKHFTDIYHASTIDSVGDSKVEWADEDGALVSYEQKGNYKLRGFLYYKNEDLKLIKRSEQVINNYEIY